MFKHMPTKDPKIIFSMIANSLNINLNVFENGIKSSYIKNDFEEFSCLNLYKENNNYGILYTKEMIDFENDLMSANGLIKYQSVLHSCCPRLCYIPKCQNITVYGCPCLGQKIWICDVHLNHHFLLEKDHKIKKITSEFTKKKSKLLLIC